MENTNTKVISVHDVTLEYKGIKTIILQVFLVAVAVLLPYIAHSLGAPVRYLLPMHWVIILAGLVYGWKGGAVTGMLAPLTSFVISGMPGGIYLAVMLPELLMYGFLTGLLREKFRMNPFIAVLISLLGGRIIYILGALSFGMVQGSLGDYLSASLLPGIYAAAAQILILPFAAKWWINAEK